MLPNERRARFMALAAEHKVSLSELSRIIDKHDGYVSRYLNDRVPYDLAPADCSRMARYFGVDDITLRRAIPAQPGRWRR